MQNFKWVFSIGVLSQALKSCFTYTPQISLLYDNQIGEIIASNILQAREGFNLLKFVCFLKLKRAWRAFSFKCSSEILKLPGEEIRVGAQYRWFLYLHGTLDWIFFFARFWKIITLRVFLEFISNIQELQKEDSVLRQFCNPILDRDITFKSSA